MGVAFKQIQEFWKRLSCKRNLIIPSEQRDTEKNYYRDTLGFSGNFLFAENLEEGRLMVLGNRGFLPVDNAGTLMQPAATIKRISLYKGDVPLRRKIGAFWLKKNTNYYIEEFSEMFKKQIRQSGHSEYPKGTMSASLLPHERKW